jgi:hypothetical protein
MLKQNLLEMIGQANSYLVLHPLLKFNQRGFPGEPVPENNTNCIRSKNENKDTILLHFSKDLVRSGFLKVVCDKG